MISNLSTSGATAKTSKPTQSPNVPASILTVSYVNYLLTNHIRQSKAPIQLDMQLYLAVDQVAVPNSRNVDGRSIYLTIAANGAFLNKSDRRLQRFIVSAWARNQDYAEIGGRIITKALHRKAEVTEETAPLLDEDNSLYRVNVFGYFRTTITGPELLY